MTIYFAYKQALYVKNKKNNGTKLIHRIYKNCTKIY